MKKKFFETVVGEDTVKMSVVKPTLAQQNEADKVYVRSKIRLINLPKDERPIPQTQVRLKLREMGVWNDEQEAELNKFDKEIEALEKVLESGTREEDGQSVRLKKSEGRQVALDLATKRLQKFYLLAEVQAFSQDITLERIAEKDQLDYLVSVCTLDENNRKVFKDLADYQAKQSEQVAIDAKRAFEDHQDEIQDWRKDYIEYKFLTKHGFMNENYQMVNKDGKLVDTEGRLINEEGQFVDENGHIIEEVSSEVGEFLDD